MIDAADDFLATTQSQYTDLMQVQLPIFSGGLAKTAGAKSQDTAMDDLHRGRREQEVMVARIQLLFGTHSRTTEQARAIFTSTAACLGMVQMGLWHNERVPPQGGAFEQDDAIKSWLKHFNSSAIELGMALSAFPAIARADIWGFWLTRKVRYAWHVSTNMGTKVGRSDALSLAESVRRTRKQV
jgi:hypothetical protein